MVRFNVGFTSVSYIEVDGTVRADEEGWVERKAL
jgi:hypothetical protein